MPTDADDGGPTGPTPSASTSATGRSSRPPGLLSGRRGAGAAVVVAGLFLVAAWWGFTAWREQSERAEALRIARTGEPGDARPILERLLATRPDWDEGLAALGDCAAAEGRIDEALAAWSRIGADSPRHREAALKTARLALDSGRFAAAETALEGPANEPKSAELAEEIGAIRQQLLLFTGRTEELRRQFEQSFATARDRVLLLRQHWWLDDESYPVQAVRDRLDRAEQETPDDDRVRLGRANLLTRTGQLGEADALLSRCEASRPHDPAVARARLAWAIAAARVDAAAMAVADIPARDMTAAQRLRLRAWFAGKRGDVGQEQRVLKELMDQAPGDTEAMERLAELAGAQGDEAAANEWRRRKGEVHAARDEYRALMGTTPRPGQFLQWARTAEACGRIFEARGWWTLAFQNGGSSDEAREALVRLRRYDQAPAVPDQSLLAWLGDDLPKVGKGPGTTAGRPIVPQFRDDAESAGLRFTYKSDRTRQFRLPETMGGGVGLIDYDGDGWLDVYVVQGGSLQPEGGTQPLGDRLFRNLRDGTFEDVTEASGLARFPGGYGHGVAVADFNNDGHADLFITRWRSYALYQNRGDGTFEDATERAGFGGDRGWPTSAAFADLDNDGDLDLYVCQYAIWDPATATPCELGTPGHMGYCVPRHFVAETDRVYRNDNGRFVDVTAEAGFTDPDGRGLGVVAADIDDDGRVDLFVANDMTANYLFRNQGDFRFQDAAMAAGVAMNASGSYQAGMGTACADLDGDGRPDLLVTNFYGESTSFFANLGRGLFNDHTADIGLAAPTRFVLGFGLAIDDLNNDGRPDLAQANGHVNDYRPVIPHAMPAQLLIADAAGRLADVSSLAGEPWGVPRLGRGLACGDLDNDGRPDLLILAQDQPLGFLHNRGPAGHALTLKLEGTDSNRDAVGARVVVTAGGRRQVGQRVGGGSFLSANDSRLHFGLGEALQADSVQVFWPSGHVDTYLNLAADRGHRLTEGSPALKPLEGWK